MSNIFELNERLGFSPPIQFQDTAELNGVTQVRSENLKVKNILALVNSQSHYEKVQERQTENNVIRIYAKKNDKVITDKSVSSLPLSGITYTDLIFYGVTISKNLVAKIEKDKSVVDLIVKDTLKWFNITNSKEKSDARITLTTMISSHVKNYPSDYKYSPPKAYEEFYELLLTCVEIGFLDISDYARTISREVFYELARQTRRLKFGEERWNPEIEAKDKKDGRKEIREYTPLFLDLTKLKQGISNTLNDLETNNNNQIDSTLGNVDRVPKFKEIIPSLQKVIHQIQNYIIKIILEGLEEVLSDLDHIIKLYNAYVVGFINGIIELIASILEGIGFLFSLFNYEAAKLLIESAEKFFSELSWSEIRKLMKKELKELFAFMIGDEAYKNAYELGIFIPKILELALELASLVIAGKKVAKKIAQIVKELPDTSRKAKKTVKEFVDYVKKIGFDKKLLAELENKGINISIEPKLNFSTFSNPVQMFDGTNYKIYYDDVLLKSFTDKAKAQKYLDRINNDDNLLNIEINNSIERVRSLIRKSKEFKLIDEWFVKNRSKFIADGQLDIDLVKNNWSGSNSIIKKELSGERFKFLDDLKKGKLENSNIAKGKLEFEIKGKIYELNYIEHAGKGRKLKNSKGAAKDKKINKEDFHDPEFEMFRANDSETKILDLIKEDFAELMKKLNVKTDDIKVKKLTIDTTYDPCNVCKKELLLFQERYGGFMEISRPTYINKDGIKLAVINNKTYIEIQK